MDIENVMKNLTLEEKALLCGGRDFWKTEPVERLGVESVMMCDGPLGLRKQLGEGDHLGINESIKTVCFPASCATASSFDVDLMYRIGETLGEECVAENIAMLLGPGINIKRSPLCGRNFEYYSEDPYLAGKMAGAYVKGLQSKGIAACVKHFAANNQETMRMTGDSVVDERTLHEIYLAAFEMVVKEAAPESIMCSYNRINGEFSAENKELLTDILRERWGFHGFVVTDWGAVKNPVKGIKAGLDLVMPGPTDELAKQIVDAVGKGELDEGELDKAVRRILAFVDGSHALQDGEQPKAETDLERDYEIAREAAAECAVLLKNESAILPLSRESKVAFIGEFAKAPRYQGAGSSHINSYRVSNACDAVQKLNRNIEYAQGYDSRKESCDSMLLQEAVEKAGAADVAVVFIGLPNAFETEGLDRRNLELPTCQNELVSAVAKTNPNTVVVLHNGAPVTMPWIDEVKAVLELYLGGDAVGETAVSLLYGETNPSGKLAETFPLRLEDTPSFLNFPGERGRVEYREGVFVGYRWYDKRNMKVLFPFGHGLSYTSFSYSNIRVDKKSLTDRETLAVSAEITNTGKCGGKEVVQLYVCDKESAMNRPVRELKAFRKVALMPGETVTVNFELDKSAFSYYEPILHDWYVESGDFVIELGSSSRDIRLSTEVAVQGTVDLPICFDRNTPLGLILSTRKGQQVLAPMMQAASGQDVSEAVNGLGEGSEQMANAMFQEMPIGALVNFGGMNEEQLQGLLQALNS